MPFVASGHSLIQHAYRERYILPAFNVCSAEMVRACIEAAEAENAPVILQTYPRDLEQISPEHMVALVKSYAEASSVPVMLHLDHGNSFAMMVACIRAGYSSVMIDGADQELGQVIWDTRRIAEIATPVGVTVEVAAESFNAGSAALTRAEDALRLKDEAGADMIAVSIGSEHGQSGQLNLVLLKTLHESLQHPLVLHGGSGIRAEDYAAARQLGVVKANIGSALYRALRQVWQTSADAANHREVYERARDALQQVARHKIRLMAAASQASGLTL